MDAFGFQQYGSADVMERLELPRPAPQSNELLLRTAAAGINPADWRIRNGQFRFFIRSGFPFVPGSDVAGVVEAVGADVTRFQPGDRVYAMLPTAAGGGYAEYVTVAEEAAAHAPASLTLAEAAAVPLTSLTALQALRDKADLQPQQQVLIYGASGGVGTFAVQIAKSMGACVTGVCSSRNVDFVRALGADAVIDYTTEDVISGETHYDIVFDAVNHFPTRQAGKTLKRGGVLVSVNPIAANPLSRLRARLGGWRIESILVKPKGTDLETLAQWIDAGQMSPVIEQTYPLTEVAVAHRRSETERTRGKLVLIVDEKLAESRRLAESKQ